MKILVSFLLGGLCSAGAMFYLGFREPAPLDVADCHGEAAAVNARPQRSAAAGSAEVVAGNVSIAATLPAAALENPPADTPAVAATAASPDTPLLLENVPASAVNGLLIPVAGVRRTDLTDTFTQSRSEGRVHDAIDIMAPRGTPVVAANDGKVMKLFTSKPGGLTVYQFAPEGKIVYYYAHLDSYAPGLAEGQWLHRGDPVGFVGSTGNASAEAPHLHFEIGVLGPEQHWWQSRPINPYGRLDDPPTGR